MTTTRYGLTDEEFTRAIIEFENGDLEEDPSRYIEFFQYLVDTGKAWTLPGVYGRTAAHLIEQGYVKHNEIIDI